VSKRLCLLDLCVAALLSLAASPTFAQQPDGLAPSNLVVAARQDQAAPPPAAVQKAETAVKGAVRRFRIGFQGGVTFAPELIDLGIHARFGPVFTEKVEVRPGLEFGFGEVTTMFAVNVDVLYTLGDATQKRRWVPYVGAGPTFALSHRAVDTTSDPEADVSSRFDFSDSEYQTGVNIIAGVREKNGMSLEAKATINGVQIVTLLIGFSF